MSPGAADELLEAVGLHDDAGTVAAELAPGQRRRLAMACSTVHAPAALLLDGTLQAVMDPAQGTDRVSVERIAMAVRERMP